MLNLSIPPELAWIIPIVLPFIIGLLLGAIIKKAFKILILVAALIIVLVFTGVISLSFSDLFSNAMKVLPTIYNAGAAWLNLLPYSSITFIIGLVLGLVFF